jgi:hypothetical protein
VRLTTGAIRVEPEAQPLFIFGSHLAAQRALVGAVGEQLSRYGIELFVAHDSIDHDALWQAEIEKALDRADAGLVFLHDGFSESAWCDQEVDGSWGGTCPSWHLALT